jgi:hypothetical protein
VTATPFDRLGQKSFDARLLRKLEGVLVLSIIYDTLSAH